MSSHLDVSCALVASVGRSENSMNGVDVTADLFTMVTALFWETKITKHKFSYFRESSFLFWNFYWTSFCQRIHSILDAYFWPVFFEKKRQNPRWSALQRRKRTRLLLWYYLYNFKFDLINSNFVLRNHRNLYYTRPRSFRRGRRRRRFRRKLRVSISCYWAMISCFTFLTLEINCDILN